MIAGTDEIAIVGKEFQKLAYRNYLKQYIPHRVLMASEQAIIRFPYWPEKPVLSHLQFICAKIIPV